MYCWLAAGCLLLLLSFFLFPSFHLISSHSISFHLIPSHFISFPISCHVPSGDELDQYLKVDQWKKTSEKKEEEKKSKKNEEEKESEKKEEEKKSEKKQEE